MNHFKSFFKFFLNKNEKFEVKSSGIRVFALGAFYIGVFATLVNFFLKISPVVTISSFTFSLVCLVVFALCRYPKLVNFLGFLLTILILILCGIMWIFNGGIDGTALEIMIFTLILITFTLSFSYGLVSLIFLLVEITVLILLQNYCPNLIIPYETKEYRYIDLYWTLVVGLIVVFFGLRFFLKLTIQDQIKNTDMRVELESALQKITNTTDRLLASEKMAALGELTAGVAHEARNPLLVVQAVGNQIQESWKLLLMEYTDLISKIPESKRPVFKEAMNELFEVSEQVIEVSQAKKEALNEWVKRLHVEDADELMQDFIFAGLLDPSDVWARLLEDPETKDACLKLLHFGELGYNIVVLNTASDRVFKQLEAVRNYAYRKPSSVWENVNIIETLEIVLTLFQKTFKSTIQVEKKFPSSVSLIKAQSDELIQVWTNLISNAVQAMNDKGLLSIEVKELSDMVQVIISDTGPGVPEEIRKRIFEPYFTTKPKGIGTGLGLSIVWKILTETKGSVQIGQNIPHGAVFTITLPKIKK